MKITRFEDIESWQQARKLTNKIYALSRSGAFAHDFGLRDQIRDAAGSVMHNIAEGFDSGSPAEFIRFLRYSQRSCSEVRSQLYVALDQNYISMDDFSSLYRETGKIHALLGGFIRYLKNREKAVRTNK